ncbi:hypothetical protein ACFUGD_21755 [Streptomyces sp. NPDC057217]|uniref:hypothetical protein n=1 Tax=Streptomyces sp. NPDC057217 TaxID=3346054 RepID=UPI00362B3693
MVRTAAAQVPFLASGGKLLGAGTTGFLSEDAEGAARWTRYADGVSKVVAKGEGDEVFGSGAGSDLVVVGHVVAEAGAEEIYTSTVKVYDMAKGGEPVTFDLFARDKEGQLHEIRTRWDDASGRLVPVSNGFSGLSGWNVHDRIESVGDVAGANSADLVARDKDGILWLHRGRAADKPGQTGFDPRVRIGGGWNTYTELTGGSDLNGDGRPDLVAVDKAGDLYFYASTGDTAAPFAPRRKVGHGWGIHHQITAAGNIGGAGAGDLVARDKDGVLWLYLGRGDGTFAARTRIGGGWNAYADVVGIDDGDKDGRPDPYARTADGAAYFYAGTGDYKAPFRARAATEAGVAVDGSQGPVGQVS